MSAINTAVKKEMKNEVTGNLNEEAERLFMTLVESLNPAVAGITMRHFKTSPK